jgi:4-aminobutyrate aminotransferase-like enzyme/Ser/Thr protein kinase RdoA (MazF antagonist)
MASLLADSPVPLPINVVAELLDEHYGVAGIATRLAGDRDTNFHIAGRNGEWMLKVANPAERPSVVKTQQELLNHLRLWDPGLPLPEPVPTRGGKLIARAEVDGVPITLRLTTFLPGRTVDELGWNPALRRSALATLARLDAALRSFAPADLGAPPEWNTAALPMLRERIGALASEQQRLVAPWLDLFEAEIAPQMSTLRTQVIHGDFNPANLIVDPDRPDWLTGIIDFGDLDLAPLVADPAIAAAYVCLDGDDPVASIAAAAADYHAASPLTTDELRLFPLLAVSRLIQSVIISSWRAELHPDNREYILVHAERIWRTLLRIDLAAPQGLSEQVAGVAARTEALATADAMKVRKRHLSPGLRLSYERPLHVTDGEGVWLAGADGRRYLDAYNNVVQIGHGHPAVTAALSRQRLNTNTRYLIDDLGRFAARLSALLPDPLDTVFFANSGGEANDLAWRIARTVTGRRGMVVTANAYHGSTGLTMATSPEELGDEPLAEWVRTVPAPASSDKAIGIAAAIVALEEAGEPIAAFACDTVFSSDGIFDLPPGYLEAVFAAVRQAGGVCIADEVQAGYGRVGPRFWGFAAGAVVPDIVTIGKPMGNGHPLAAVVTTAEMAAAFAESGYYFSTFAGNPVSVAVGEAVLDVTERDRLAENAAVTGAYLRSGLEKTMADHDVAAVVRGPGLFIGVELADADMAARIQNEMRNSGVLIGRTGPRHNVLKIRPPLVFEPRHADILLDVLDDVLRSH